MYDTIKTEIRIVWIPLQYDHELLKLNAIDQRLEDNARSRR